MSGSSAKKALMWDDSCPLDPSQLAGLSQLQTIVNDLYSDRHGVDKSQISIAEPPEIQILSADHPLRLRYNQLTSNPTKDEIKDDNSSDSSDEKQLISPNATSISNSNSQSFNYVNYFVLQMSAARNPTVRLTAPQQHSLQYLQLHTAHLKNTLQSVTNLQSVVTNLTTIYAQNQEQCQNIHNKCMSLVSEQQELEAEANRLRETVKYFRDYNQMRARLFSPHPIDVLSADFRKIVQRVNECIQFLSDHLEYKESTQYRDSYKELRSKCLTMIRQFVLNRVYKAKKDTLNAAKAASPPNTDPKQMANSSAIVGSGQLNILEFRAAANTLRPVIELVENQAVLSSEYANILNSLQQSVLNIRQLFLTELVEKTILSYSQTRTTPDLMRAASSYVMMICIREYKLFGEFFDLDLTIRTSFLSTVVSRTPRERGDSNTTPRGFRSSPSPRMHRHNSSTSTPRSPRRDSNATPSKKKANIISGQQRIGTLLSDMCHLLYSHLRPFVIHESNMTTLCDVVHILQSEIRDQVHALTGGASSPTPDDGNSPAATTRSNADHHLPEFEATIVKIIEDTQERLVYRTQIHIRDAIQRYEPNNNDLNYFNLLKKIHADVDASTPDTDIAPDTAPDIAPDTAVSGVVSGVDKEEAVDEEKKENPSQRDATAITASRYGDWSLVLEATLSSLSKIYPVLNASVFEYLAHEAVSACVQTLVEISRLSAAKSSSVHGHLFLIKHLLILREQISPFEVDFSIEETTLDFTHMTQYLRDLVSTQKYSLVQVLAHAIPSVSRHQLNSKKAMEMVLKKACEAFIQTQTNLLAGPLISLISNYKRKMITLKYAAKRDDDAQQSNSDESSDASSLPPTLSEIDRNILKEEIEVILRTSEEKLLANVNGLVSLMHLYLQNPITQRILLRPIMSNIQSAFITLRKIVAESGLRERVSLSVCDHVSEKLQSIVTT